jgi:hypothetical protein
VPVGIHHDILRLQVAVDDTCCMKGSKSLNL